jgi:hypothetical protein
MISPSLRRLLEGIIGAALSGLVLLIGLPIANTAAQKMPVLGYLTNAGADPVRLADVKSALVDLGYVDGKNNSH